ncbi:helix-turn-helix domain-containing protein [Streptomyces globisporus]
MREEHPDESEPRVDGLLADLSAQRIPLPPPRERTRLRTAAGLSTEQVADTLSCLAEDIAAWEVGSREPRMPRRAAYARLLDGLKALEQPPDKTPARREPTAPAARTEQPTLFPADQAPPSPRSPAPSQPLVTPTGPLAVIDYTDTLVAHFTDGSELPLAADGLPGLLQWTLDSGLHRDKLSPYDQDGDPLIVLTPAASTALHLPAELGDRATLRLPTAHPVLDRLRQAGFHLTRRGFGPWPRVLTLTSLP